MLIFFFVLLIIILILIFILSVKWRVTIQYYGGILIIKLGKITLYNSSKGKKHESYFKIPKLGFEDFRLKYKSSKELYQDEKHEVGAILQEAKRILDIKMLNIAVTFGFGDAALTGIANGFIWTGITGIVSILKRYIDVESKTNIAVYPLYTESSCFKIDICLIFETKVLKMLGIFKRIRQLIKRNKCKIKSIGGVANGFK